MHNLFVLLNHQFSFTTIRQIRLVIARCSIRVVAIAGLAFTFPLYSSVLSIVK